MITMQDLLWGMDGGKVYLNEAEFEPIARHAAKSKLLVEIGTAWGATAVLMLLNAPVKARVHSIDPFVPDSHGGWVADPAQTKAHIQNAAARLGFDASRWVLHQDYSYSAVKEAPARVDLLFIDGDHHYDAVKRDLEDWLPLVKSGGVVMLHDSRRPVETPAGEFNMGWEGPTQLANELRTDARVELVEEVYSLTVWRKL